MRFLKYKDACDELKVTRITLNRWGAKGLISIEKIDGVLHYDIDSIIRVEKIKIEKPTKVITNKWNYEKAKEEASKYQNRTQLIKNEYSCYNYCYKNNLLDEFLPRILKPKGYWNIDTLRSESCKYKTRKEFYEGSFLAYQASLKLNILDEVCVGLERSNDLNRRCIYLVSFSDNYIYIGLTCNYERRINEHLRGISSNTILSQPVYNHILLTGLTPEFKLLHDYTDVDIVGFLERKEIDNYKKLGYNILNKAKAGSLGGTILKWSLDACLDESIKYKSLSEFSKTNRGCYSACSRHKYKGNVHLSNLPDKFLSKFKEHTWLCDFFLIKDHKVVLDDIQFEDISQH